MFEFLRRKNDPEPNPETKALPEAAGSEVDAADAADGTDDEALKTAVEAALVERAEAEVEPAPAPAPAGTMVGPDMLVDGSLSTRSPLLVAGEIEGDVDCGLLTLQSDGNIRGDVRASEDVVIRGTVTGDMNVAGKLTIATTGRVLGNVSARAIIMDEGGELRGRCSMGGDDVSPPGLAVVPA